MNDVKYVVYWMMCDRAVFYETDNLKDALAQCDYARSQGFSFVTMVADNPNCTSKVGASIATEYEWKKRR